MKIGKIAKSNQEQAVASWINYLNQIRLESLMNALNSQNKNLEDALNEINKTFSVISHSIIERNRGGNKGMHGFIAEVAECGVGNARRQIEGKLPNYIWVDDNSPIDIIRDGIKIQQKFSASGNHLSLQAVKQHFEHYPWFLDEGGKYQIPKDHYDKIKYLLSLSQEEANKMPTSTGEFSLKQWREVNEFFRDGSIGVDDIEPSKLSYKAAQANSIKQTLADEKKSLKETDKAIREQAYEKSKPTLKQGMQSATVSAAIEGGTALIIAINAKRKTGKHIKEFTADDWKDICKETGIGTLKGGVRGISIYALTNYTATPAAVASSLCTASFGIAQQAYLLRKGNITEEQFIVNSEMLCLDTAVSALSSFIGQSLIPVPVLGAVIGNTVGTFMYQIAKDNLSKKEQKLIIGYLKELEVLDAELDAKYRKYVKELNKQVKYYYELLDKAFSPDYHQALVGSAQLAIWIGVPNEEVLKNINDIDHYFMD